MFYTYGQNNSGGCFVIDDEVTHYVIIEADSPNEANEIAKGHGIYFDGCSKGLDCSCCGDRWYEAYEAQSTPQIYGKSPAEHKPFMVKLGQPYAYVYYSNDNKEVFLV